MNQESKQIRLAINGFGRIGRAAFKIALESDEIEVVAINDLGNLDNLAYLLRYDTAYGRYGRDVAVDGDTLIVDERSVSVLQEPKPAELPWREMKIDVVVEATGVFTDKKQAGEHIKAGAKHVIITAPTASAGVSTIVRGVNDEQAQGEKIISTASCTTNCAALVVAVMDKVFGVEKGLLTTVHAYTATQNLVDGPTKGDLRRGRAGAINIVPSSTGAAAAVAKAYSPLEDKFDGVSLRVPVPVVSIGDFVFVVKGKVSVDAVNKAFVEAVDDPTYQDVLAITDEPVVSSDFIGDPHSAIVDLSMTRVVGGDLVKVMAWYDNEWGYSNRLVEQVIALGES